MHIERIRKGVRVRGEDRASLKERVLDAYRGGASIRTIAADLGRSYGFVHTIIAEAGGTFRQRGGYRRTPKS